MPSLPITISASGDNTLLPARANMRYVLNGCILHPAAAVTATWKSGANTLSGPMPLASKRSLREDFSPLGRLQTNFGEALALNLSGAVTVAGHLSFSTVIGPTVDLYDGLIEAWNFSEGPGSLRRGSFAGRDLTERVGFPADVALGKIGSAVRFPMFATETYYGSHLFRDSEPALQIAAGKSLTINVWVYPFDIAGTPIFFYKAAGGGTNNEYWLGHNATGFPDWTWRVYLGGDSATFNTAATPGIGFSSQLNQWYMVTADIDATEATIGIRVNAGARASTALTGSPTAGTAKLRLAGDQLDNPQYLGLLDAAGMWNRRLSDEEISLLYNSGNGLEFPF